MNRNSSQIGKKNGKERYSNGRFGPGNRGRPKGSPNKIPLTPTPSQQIKDVARQIILGDFPAQAIEQMAERVRSGNAEHLEKFFLEHLWGKPREHISVSLTEVHLLAVRTMSDLELGAFLQALEQQKPDEALRLLPGGGMVA